MGGSRGGAQGTKHQAPGSVPYRATICSPAKYANSRTIFRTHKQSHNLRITCAIIAMIIVEIFPPRFPLCACWLKIWCLFTAAYFCLFCVIATCHTVRQVCTVEPTHHCRGEQKQQQISDPKNWIITNSVETLLVDIIQIHIYIYTYKVLAKNLNSNTKFGISSF